MDAKGVRNTYSILVVVNKHNTARVASCWFIIYIIIKRILEICALLVYCTAYNGNSLPTFRELNLSVTSSMVMNPFLTLEDGTGRLSRNFHRNYHRAVRNIPE